MKTFSGATLGVAEQQNSTSLMPSRMGWLIASLNQPDHSAWVIAQQACVRSLVALKFLVVGRLLGPEAVGLIGIALLALAMIESLSDTGLPQAIIQRPLELDSTQLGAVWSLLLARGIGIALFLVIAAQPLAFLFNMPEAGILIAISALLPFIRNGLCPGYFLAQRRRDFRSLAFLEISTALLDLLTAIALIYFGAGPMAVIVAAVLGEGWKVLWSWLAFKITIKPNIRWTHVRDLTAYGKWVWGSSIITLLINQLDKILVARLLGATEFGLYQMAGKLAQLAIADGSIALSQYLFPTFSARYRISPLDTHTYFIRILQWVIAGVIVIASVVALLAPDIVHFTLGQQWVAAADLLRVLILPMGAGALIAVLVVYARAIGKPWVVTHALLIQLLVLIIFAVLLVQRMGAVGMALASFAGIATAAGCIFFQLKKDMHQGIFPPKNIALKNHHDSQ